MKPHILHTLKVNIGYGKMLAADIPDERFTAQPVAGVVMNHPAWVLGHIARAGMRVCQLLGRDVAISAAENDLYGMQSSPKPDRSAYPSKEELLRHYEHWLTQAGEAFAAASDAQLQAPSPELFAARFPKIGDFVVFILTAHTATHLGQLSMWRRALGMQRVF